VPLQVIVKQSRMHAAQPAVVRAIERV